MKNNLKNGNCLEVLKSLSDNSIDSIVTDPPYGLSFMGKKWDYDVPSVEIWRECLRVLKPGGHLLSFGGTRTYHRLAVNIEDAGFEIRDQIQWLYGSGFPKSLDVSKAIDKAAGAERTEILGKKHCGLHHRGGVNSFTDDNWKAENRDGDFTNITAPSTDSAKQWQGWGTALKPANEPICVARKPLEKGLTVAQNVQKWGTGAINIDGSRIEGKPRTTHADGNYSGKGNRKHNVFGVYEDVKLSEPQGRWPANVILDEEAAALLDEQSIANGIHSAGKKRERKENFGQSKSMFGIGHASGSSPRYEEAENIGASRFFYCAKASKSERNAGLEGMPDKILDRSGGAQSAAARGEKYDNGDSSFNKTILAKNHHPTVKPIKLMEYLIKLVTPHGGTVLDPFMGSGATGVAAQNNDFGFIGVELDEEYFKIAEKRIEASL